MEQTNSHSAAYNVPFGWHIRGPLSIPALQTALDRIVQRHSIFQTSFHEENGVPLQTVSGACPFVVTTGMATVDELCRQPFDLTSPPLMRAHVLICGDEEYFLTLVVHHLIFDGWSKMLFVRELNAEYSRAVRGLPSTLIAPAVQYLDYAVWHREWLETEVINEQMAYWRAQLAPATKSGSAVSPCPHGSELPTDRPRTLEKGDTGDVLYFSLPPALYKGVERLRKDQMTTHFVVLLAAFNALLHRYTGEEEIVVGSVAANRTRPEIRNVIGCFVNTLVLRTQVCSTMRFRDLLLATEETARGAFAHQDTPFERLVAALKPERSPNRSPLFQVMFALQNAGSVEIDLAGTKARPVPLHNGCAKFDLSVELSDQPGKVRARIEYNTALFDRDTVHRMAVDYAVLLEGAIADPDTQLRHLPLLSRSEKRRLNRWNDTATAYPRSESVPALFSEVASRMPSVLAIADGPTRWTYAELERHSDALAAALHRSGVGRGTLVAVAASRRPETIAAMLGILKVGGAYVPIDPSSPSQRIQFMLEDSGAHLMLVPRALLKVFPSCSTQILCIEELIALSEKAKSLRSPCTEGPAQQNDGSSETECARATQIKISPDDLAYVLYTSGSTGTPKGVCVPHRAIIRLVRNSNYITIGETDVIAQASSLAFDAATFEVWGALLNGARLEFLQQDVVLSPARLAEAIRSEGVTVLFLTTSIFNLVANALPSAFVTLRTLLFGGEAADAGAVRTVLAHGRPERLLNVYGPTETTTFATWHQIDHVPSRASTVPIGIPISNTEIHLLDAEENLVPIGARGEIYIGGDGVALGYLGRPDLTAEKFVERQIGDTPGRKRLYRTGDFAVRRSDGAITFLGRADDQVKIRGFRIELREIEIALRQHPEVRECCVVLRQNDPAGKHLVAYIAGGGPRATLSARDFRDWLRTRLPDYMLPADFVFLPRLPLNNNGKVDRPAFPAPKTCGAQGNAAAPWIPLHVQLIHLWEELLQVKPIGMDDDFFDLGGHSLLAVRLVDAIEQACGLSLPVSTLFGSSTIRKLAEAILKADVAPKTLMEIQSGGSRTPLYFMHGDLFGGGLYCRQLARQLGPQQPFLSLAPCHANTGETLPSIESMAAEHLREIRSHRPHGPYRLGGFCVSAIVALEVAQELWRSGEEVEGLVMVDPPAPRSLWWLRRWIDSRSIGLANEGQDRITKFNRGFNRVYRVRELWRQDAAQKLRWLRRAFHRKTSSPAPSENGTFDRTAGAYLWATAGYQPAAYRGKAVVLCCDSVMGSGAVRIKMWKKYLKQLDAHTLDCKHLELVTSRSADLAAVLSAT